MHSIKNCSKPHKGFLLSQGRFLHFNQDPGPFRGFLELSSLFRIIRRFFLIFLHALLFHKLEVAGILSKKGIEDAIIPTNE